MICFVTTVRQTLEPVAHYGFRDHESLTTYREHMREQSTAGIVDRVIATKEIRIVNLDKTEGIRTFRSEAVRSLVIVRCGQIRTRWASCTRQPPGQRV